MGGSARGYKGRKEGRRDEEEGGEGDAGPFGAGGSKFSTYEHDYEMLLFSSLSASLFASFLEMPSSLVEFLSFSPFFFSSVRHCVDLYARKVFF